ncbi:MAG: DUF4292 domain-containing protein [Bacteroidales bacterium]|nr:DUF4292 domain-containing protein [Bacteroidales bacterium]
MMRNRLFIVLFALLLTASSCASRKKTVAPAPPQSFEWLTANLSIQAEGNGMAYNDLSGQLRMRKDSIVWLSVTATMGVEVLRAKISNDSIWILNRLEKTYLAEHVDSLDQQIGPLFGLRLPFAQFVLLDNIEGIPPVENQTVGWNQYDYYTGEIKVKLKYSNIKLDQPTTFPLKITNKMERIQLPMKQ